MEHYEKLEDYLKAKEETSSKLKAMRMMGIPIAISPPKTSYVNSQLASEDEYSEEEEEEEEVSSQTEKLLDLKS